MASYVAALDAVRLPAEEEALTTAHRDAATRATEGFRRDRFGRGAVTVKSLRARLEEIRDARAGEERVRERTRVRGARDVVRGVAGGFADDATSIAGTDDRQRRVRTSSSDDAVGPSHPTYAARVARSLERERAAFTQSYNARLLNGMLLFSVGGIVAFRFVWVLPPPSSRRGPRSSSSSWVLSSTSPRGSPCSTRRGGKRQRGSGNSP